MNVDELISIFQALQDENEEIRNDSTAKLDDLLNNRTPELIDLSTTIILADNFTNFIYQNAFIALKNVLSLPQSQLHLSQLWSTTLSPEQRENFKTAIIRGLMFEDQSIGRIASLNILKVFEIERTEFPVFESLSEILGNEESLPIRQNVVYCVKEIIESGVFNDISFQLWKENYSETCCSIFSTVLSYLKDGVEYESEDASQVFLTESTKCLTSLLHCLKRELLVLGSQISINNIFVEALRHVTDVNLCQAIWDFFFEQMTVFYAHEEFIFLKTLLSELLFSFYKVDPRFVCIAFTTLSNFSEYEEGIENEKKGLEKYESVCSIKSAEYKLTKKYSLPTKAEDVKYKNYLGKYGTVIIKPLIELVCTASTENFAEIEESSLSDGSDEVTINYLPLQAASLLKKLMRLFTNEITNDISSNRAPNFASLDNLAVLLLLQVLSETKSTAVKMFFIEQLDPLFGFIESNNPVIAKFAFGILINVSKLFPFFEEAYNVVRVMNVSLAYAESDPRTVSIAIDCMIQVFRNADLSKGDVFDTIIPVIMEFCTGVLGREDAIEENLVPKAYEVMEEIIVRSPKDKFEVTQSIFQTAFDQINELIDPSADSSILQRDVIISCLLKNISHSFISFPEEMQEFGHATSDILFKMASDASSPNYKDVLDTLITVVYSLKEGSRELLEKLSECIDNALKSKSPEIIADTIVMLQILIAHLSGDDISSFGSIIDSIFTIIEGEEMLYYIPTILRAISGIFLSMKSFITVEHKEQLFNSLMQMAKLGMIQEQGNVDFRNQVLVSFFSSAKDLILTEEEMIASKEGTCFFSSGLKTLREMFAACNTMHKFPPYSTEALSSFAEFINVVFSLFGNSASPVLVREKVIALLFACIVWGNDKTKQLADTLLSNISSL